MRSAPKWFAVWPLKRFSRPRKCSNFVRGGFGKGAKAKRPLTKPGSPCVCCCMRPGGVREIVGLVAGPSEAEPFWTKFLRDLTRRGLRGVKLVISDAHVGLKATIAKVFATRISQRCWDTRPRLSGHLWNFERLRVCRLRDISQMEVSFQLAVTFLSRRRLRSLHLTLLSNCGHLETSGLLPLHEGSHYRQKSTRNTRSRSSWPIHHTNYNRANGSRPCVVCEVWP